MVSNWVVRRPVTVNDDAVVVSWLTADSVTPLMNVAVPAVGVEIATFVAVAEDGTTDISPSPSAETTTSARRLKFVFVDIDFLSSVVRETFSLTAGEEKLFAS